MSTQQPYIGEYYAPAYQVAGVPFATSSAVALGATIEIDFPYATKELMVKNNTSSTSVALAFTQNGLRAANSNFITISGGEQVNLDVKVDRIFISGSAGSPNVSVYAALTCVPLKNFTTVTGSAGYGGVG